MEKASLAEFRPLPEGAEQYPLEYIENNSVIKLRENGESILIGICNPSDILLLENLKNFHRKQVDFFEIDRSELAGYLGDRLSQVSPKPGGTAPNEKLLLDKLANDAPVINLVNSILIEAIRQEASDIHIEGYAERMVVRYRLDGYLHTVRQLDRESFPAVSTRIKIMANLNIMERRRPQDGRITVHLGGDMLDMRVSVIPIADGESFVLRLFSKKKTPLTLEQLGLSNEHRELLVRIARRPNGLILVTGPTGSGKTTSLNAVLQHIKSDTQKIITIEDPIEYVIDGVNQIQTNDRIGLSFDTILRRVLRQDPNIIMVGEIRDNQTAELAIRAALTGHLVLSTLHTRDSVSVITRLKNMQIEPYLIAAVLRGSIAQRLVRRICPDCRKKLKPTRAEAALLRRHGLEEGPVYRGEGCKACHQSGFRGRIGLFELFESNAEVEEMIVSGKRDAEIRSYLASQGLKPIVADGFSKVLQGLTTVSEIEKAIAG
jgi:type II secretory ATPase GspE/PulE/Tfp pilus assembly ATPase PilB-like protein